MFSSLDDKCSSTDSNNVDNDARNAKKRRHLTIKSVTNEEDDTTDWKPSNWEKTLQNIREMCKDVIVPLDYMGFDQSMDPNESPEVNTQKLILIYLYVISNIYCCKQKKILQVIRYQVLILLILSALTVKSVKFAVLERLKTHGLTVDNILETSEEQLANLICPVKFRMVKLTTLYSFL